MPRRSEAGAARDRPAPRTHLDRRKGAPPPSTTNRSMMRSIHPSRLIKVAAAVALVTCTGSAHAQEPEAAAVDAPPTIADTSTMDPGLVR